VAAGEQREQRAAWEDLDAQAGLLAIAAAVLWGSATVLCRELAFPITGILANVLIVVPEQSFTAFRVAGVCVLWLALAALQRAKEPAIEPAAVSRLTGEVSLETPP
jgi:drug/metabolite transporter (DMT)-like permease